MNNQVNRHKAGALISTLTARAGDLRCFPLAVGPAAHGGGVSLDEAFFAVIPDQGADLIPSLGGPKHLSTPHHGGLPT